jgi:DNA-binding transcriptional MerR regulator
MCREFGVTPRALRFYEQQGLLAPARRQQARVYGHKDRVRLQLILSGRKAGISLRQMRELFELYDQKGIVAQSAKALPLLDERIEALTQELAEIDSALEALRIASAHFEARLSGQPH